LGILLFPTMLSCPRCGNGNLKEGKITQHASYLIYCMGPSLLFHAQRGTLAKKCSHELMLSGSYPSTGQQQIRGFNALTVDCHYPFHPPQGHSTQLQTQCHVRVSLSKKIPKVFLEHLHYFHTWSCLLAPKYKANLCRISGNQRCNNPQTTSTILFGVDRFSSCAVQK
jgi:hypothetical protein